MMPTPTAPDPFQQPLRPATALVVVAVLQLLLTIAAAVLAIALVPWLEGAMMAEGAPSALVVVALLGIGAGLLMMGLGLATFILAIVVTVKGRGKLRHGAVILIVVAALGASVSFTTSGDPSMMGDLGTAVAGAFDVVTMVLGVIRALAGLVGVVLLLLGIREVRRRRAATGEARSMLH